MKKIDGRLPDVHLLFEGLLAGTLEQITPQQAKILAECMESYFGSCRKRGTEYRKLVRNMPVDVGKSYNQAGKHQRTDREPVVIVSLKDRIEKRLRQVLYLCIFLCSLIIGWGIYNQYFQ